MVKMSNVCMNCKREPERFESDRGEECYWMVIPKGDESPTVLMSNLELMFYVCPTKDYVAQDGEYFMCIQCFEAMYPEAGEETTQ